MTTANYRGYRSVSAGEQDGVWVGREELPWPEWDSVTTQPLGLSSHSVRGSE